MTDRVAQLGALVESIRKAELALEVARLQRDADELEAAEARLATLRERHGRLSGWLTEGGQ